LKITALLKDEFLRSCDAESKAFMKSCVANALASGMGQEEWLRIHAREAQLEVSALRSDAYDRCEWSVLAAYFERCGRQIFDLSDALVEELAHTDIDGVTLEQLTLPFDAIFVRLGQQKDLKRRRVRMLEKPTEEFVDGAFVVKVPGSLRIGLTLSHEDGTAASLCRPIDIPDDAHVLPCNDAIAVGCQRQSSLHEDDDPGEGARYVAQAMKSSLEESERLLVRALPLVINSLFYIESLEKTFVRSPGRDASAERREHWSRATDEGRRKLASKLEQDGYGIVYMVGTEVSSAHEHAAERGLIAPHWRRGHWRMQRHGPQRSLVKRIRIKPILVNADRAEDEPVAGHVYKV
jgi:hypothetical protein